MGFAFGGVRPAEVTMYEGLSFTLVFVMFSGRYCSSDNRCRFYGRVSSPLGA